MLFERGSENYRRPAKEEIANTRHVQILRLTRKPKAGLLDDVPIGSKDDLNVQAELVTGRSLRVSELRIATRNMIGDRGLCHP